MPSKPIKSIDELPEVLTPEQLGAWLQVSLAWIYTSAKAGDIPHFRLCRSSGQGRGVLRFNKAEVLQWWEQQREKAA